MISEKDHLFEIESTQIMPLSFAYENLTGLASTELLSTIFASKLGKLIQNSGTLFKWGLDKNGNCFLKTYPND